MQPLNDQTVVVAGASGNIGPFVVRALLERGARVAVPSRSAGKLRGLREHLSSHVDETGLGRLHTFVGDLGDERDAAVLRRRISEEAGTPDAVVASVGDFVTTPSLLEASADELQRALDGYLLANFVIARTFLPVLKASGGTYVLLQGPLAFELHPELGADLISVATAAQHMLFRALAQELDGSRARVVELVSHAFIRDRQTQPGSPLSGEEVGGFVAYLLSGADEEVHGRSIHLRSPEQLSDVGLDTEALDALTAEGRVPSG
jgi:NAD(P)-dependent dehydrogenase (short-subunit alcohol dehydrogenase family)